MLSADSNSTTESCSSYLHLLLLNQTWPTCHLHTSACLGSVVTIYYKPSYSVQIEALILSANSNLTLAEIEDTFQFPLDGFQQQAVLRFLEGKSVLVCAPTGAGKTAIAEAAAVAVLARSVLLHNQLACQVQHTPRTLVVSATWLHTRFNIHPEL